MATDRGEPPAAPAGWQAGADLRYEIKLVAEEALLGEVVASLRLSPAAFSVAWPARWVQSLYLDTHEGDAHEDNLAGVSEREKLRLRWYGRDGRAVAAVLESKRRNQRLGWKERLVLGEPLDVAGASRRGLAAALRRRLPASWRRRLLDDLEFVQWIRYRRDYYESASGRLRVTVDRDLMAFDQRHRMRLASRGGQPLGGIVVECKAAPADHEELVEVVGELPLVVDRCSKFARAVSDEAAPVLSLGRR